MLSCSIYDARYVRASSCANLHTLVTPPELPIVVVSGESGGQNTGVCGFPGSSRFFEKPVNFPELKKRLRRRFNLKSQKSRLTSRAHAAHPELKGQDEAADLFEQLTTTET